MVFGYYIFQIVGILMPLWRLEVTWTNKRIAL